MTAAQERLLTHFASAHLPAPLHRISTPCSDLAYAMVERLESVEAASADEVTEGLRKLLEARECFMRAAQALTPSRPAPATEAVPEHG